MRLDLHNHTILCKHAQGSVDEYILKAIELGIDVYGFSCHSPMDFDPDYRMSFQDFPKYLEMINQAKKTYADRIEILLGLEVDFIHHKENLLKQEILKQDLDYLIGSVHFLDDWGFDNPEFIREYAQKNMQECWNNYLVSIEKMAQTGFFQIVGHFDLLKIFNHQPPKEIFKQIKQTLEALKDNHMVIEINSAGLRKPIKEQYPSAEILKLVQKMDIPITFSSDAHSVSQVGFGYEECKNLALSLGFKEAVFFRDKIMQKTLID